MSFGPYVFSPTPTELGQTEGEGVWYADTVLLDLDGDGVLDWAAITSPATIATVPCTLAAMRGHGDGTFGPDLLWKITEGGACRLVFTADLSGKGNPSIILQSGGSYITHIVSGGQGIPYTEGTGLSTYGFWPADLTGDGRPELICMVPMDDHFYGFTVAVNDGQGNLSVPDPTAVPPPASFTMQSESAVAVSFDDPSKKEVVLLSNLTSTLIVGYQDSKLTLAQTSLPPGFIAAAKVLGNGRSQLFARSGAMYDPSPDVSIVTQVATFPPLLFDADNLDFGDVDGDGRTDVLWTSSDSGQTVVFRQNVDATFSQVWAGKGYTRFADVNGDGLPDLVQRQNNVAAALNTTK